MSAEQTPVTSLSRGSICFSIHTQLHSSPLPELLLQPGSTLSCNVTESCQWCVCTAVEWSCSIPKARWRSRRVVTQLARPLLSTGQNNYVLEWKPSLQGRDGPRNGCKRSPSRDLDQILRNISTFQDGFRSSMVFDR